MPALLSFAVLSGGCAAPEPKETVKAPDEIRELTVMTNESAGSAGDISLTDVDPNCQPGKPVHLSLDYPDADISVQGTDLQVSKMYDCVAQQDGSTFKSYREYVACIDNSKYSIGNWGIDGARALGGLARADSDTNGDGKIDSSETALDGWAELPEWKLSPMGFGLPLKVKTPASNGQMDFQQWAADTTIDPNLQKLCIGLISGKTDWESVRP